ncbi:MAG: hypothetical protein KDI27_11885 [Gammaproteobacteria bacterium]|nr:hypothetical protein [Gammaproteobacteria bacterium]MCB1850756.1 hypothetical protein [Gammaproteobacteria bacterium]MCP5415526.1 hypothetical protein [Chromatiaceae bacterium]
MSENSTQLHSSMGILAIFAALIGLLLVLTGALTLIHAAYTVWDLYDNPDAILAFARTFNLIDSSAKGIALNGLDPERLITWPFVILLLMLQGKVGIWVVEAGARLLGTARKS